jgi:carboxyl-terminal processing protease
MGWIALSALTVLIIAGSGSTGVPANSSLLPQGSLAPTERQRPLARRIGTILTESHYRRATIDDRMSEGIFDDYLDSLDVQRSYFLASDITEFNVYRTRFDDMIRSGDVEPAFLMFARFQQRNRERIRHALELLKTEPDWTIDETFEFDREHAPWPATTLELDELWRKRVKNDGLSLLLAGKTWAEATDTLSKRYERVLKRADQVTADEVFENLMNAYARSFDPHSSYFSARNSEEYRIQMSLSYEGIGATLQSTDDLVSIVNLLPGGPAAVDGTLKINDRITAIAQGSEGAFQEVIGQRLDDVVQLIRGKGGTMVRLQVLPAGAAPGSPEKVIELKRGKVTLEGQASKKERRTLTRNGRTLNIGVITVPGFYQDVQAQNQGDQNYRSTTRDVSRLIDELRKEGPLDGLILDLRGDGGGFLPEATALTGLFIDKGPVVQLKDTTGRIEVLDDPVPGTTYDGPLLVMVDRYSASASEIFAAAIQDYRRGYVVGQRTFGKGTVQNLVPLDRWTQRPVDGQLTVTIGKFYRVTGESTQHRGVEPDILLPSPISLEDVGESTLDDALPWDRIAPARFTTIASAGAMPTALVLDRDEATRARQDPDYQWLVGSIEANEKVRQQKSISLNLAKRKLERESLDTQRLTRENTRRTALGKPVFKALEELEAAPDVTGDDAPDILLDRTTQIMADMVSAPKVPPTLARKVPAPVAE